MDLHEEILHRTYSRPERGIPILPNEIDGRTYFNKAKDRDRAALMGLVSEPRMVDPAPQFTMTRKEMLRVHHWEGSRCTALRMKRWPGSRMSILNGQDFDRLLTIQQCKMCRHQFDNS